MLGPWEGSSMKLRGAEEGPRDSKAFLSRVFPSTQGLVLFSQGKQSAYRCTIFTFYRGA